MHEPESLEEYAARMKVFTENRNNFPEAELAKYAGQWIAWGPGIRRGHQIESPISTTDTAATALWALGLPAPAGAIGRPVLEAFEADPSSAH